LDLEDLGALVKMVPAGDMGCVLKSQIVRVLAFLLPEVRYLVCELDNHLFQVYCYTLRTFQKV
jgi:hypothetical protein